MTEVYVVNWLGYPASLWPFEGPVVQFHGENGAGKTTAMAAIVATLVPNAKRIDSIFSGGSQGHAGLRSKIGINGNPSYSVLHLENEDGSSFYLGVRLLLNPAIQVGVSVTSFVAHDFPNQPDPYTWLAVREGDTARVAALEEISDAAGRAGGKFRQFSNPGDYYTYLYQLGILPRPLKDREDQEQFANLYLAGFGGDAAQLVYRLKDHFLPELRQLSTNLQTMDEVYCRLIRGRADIDAYEAQLAVLERLWTAANDLVRYAWVNDEFRYQAAHTESLKAEADMKSTVAEETHEKAILGALMTEEPGLKTTAQEAVRIKEQSRDAIQQQIARLERAIDQRKRIDSNQAALPALAELTAVVINDWPSFVTARKKAKTLRTTSVEAAINLRTIQADIDRHIAALAEGSATVQEVALARQPRFADLDIEAARQLQAKLGPAADAIVTETPDHAAAAALRDPSAPEHSWFIKSENLDQIAEPFSQVDGGIIVTEGAFLRASKLSNRPIFGAVARERALGEFKAERDRITITLGIAEREITAIDRALDACSISHSADLFPDESLSSIVTLKMRRDSLQSVLSAHDHDDLIAITAVEDRDIVETWRNAVVDATKAETKWARSTSDIASSRERVANAAKHTTRAREASSTALALLIERTACRNSWFEQADGEQLLSHLSEPAIREKLQPVFATDGLGKLAAAAAQTLQEQLSDPSILRALPLTGGEATDHILQARLDQSAVSCLRVWRLMRDAAFSLMPRNLTSTNNPVEACAALSARVAELRVDVERAEGVFRVEALAIRTAIENTINRQRRRIEGLNRGSVDAHFGDLSGIRLKLSAKTELLDLLDRHMIEVEKIGADMGFAEALEAVARSAERAQRRALMPDVSQLTDYRNYAELGVEVRHRESQVWRSLEEEDPSTGERIGIAFVCLLRVLEAWETRSMDTSLLPSTCLKFLVIDEAARLDSKGLATVAAFAQAANAQVLIASPQEQPIPGGTTTYTFVRTRGPDGAPRVVTRRRVLTGDRGND